MKYSKFFVLFLLITIIITSSFIGCSTEQKYTAEEWKKIQDNEMTAQTSTANTTALTIDTENQSKINDFNNRLYEWKKFCTDCLNAKQKIDQDIEDLDSKRVEAAKNKDFEKSQAYFQVEIDKYEEVINSLSKIYVPEIAKEHYSYLLDYYTKSKQWLSYVSDLTLGTNYDASKVDSLRDESNNAGIKATKELERIGKGFNQEAQELGLTIPFPNLNK